MQIVRGVVAPEIYNLHTLRYTRNMNSKLPVTCPFCQLHYKSNLSGHFSMHLEKKHNVSLRDYVVQFEYDGIVPICACGLCNEMPEFSRGKFLTHAMNHRHFDAREQLWKLKFGVPLCRRIECANPVKFSRGIPQQYCSPHCFGLCNGFSLAKTQQKIKEVVWKRYGVTNVRKIDSVKKKVVKAQKQSRIDYPEKWIVSNITKEKHSAISKIRWGNLLFREKTKKAQQIAFARERERRITALFSNSKNRLSKLHVRIQNHFDLTNLGFQSEQYVEGYFADELHRDKKVIVEINGDYLHANPKKFSAEFLVKIRGQSYTAQEKWNADARRTAKLENVGYKVFVIWESDDWEKKKNELERLLDDNI